MNDEAAARASLKFGIFSLVLLVYWVFIFISITVFQFKVFRENITEIFYLSILGIMSCIVGALIANLMLNLQRIADRTQLGSRPESSLLSRDPRRLFVGFLVSLPAIFALLYAGDYLTTNRKQAHLVAPGQQLLSEYRTEVSQLADYTFDRPYVVKATRILTLLSKSTESFPTVSVIHKDMVGNSKVFLRFDHWRPWADGDEKDPTDYLFAGSKDERAYLNSVFAGESTAYRFSAADGRYELYLPVETPEGSLVIYFSERRTYGKLGS